ncbi:DEP domain-containing mTOR-interacting protein isoform X3 [Hydra vulgaris]|uniref:DEP domain-containing mTOR-interacting protein isoform X3 n=1 Tax=Hydra vulgaris TaxID=6087 RepID=A0ABM4BI95_HYDVU
MPSPEEILVLGEILRLKIHKAKHLIKSCKNDIGTFPYSFVGHEVVEWLVKNDEVQNKDIGITAMRILQENGILHHVCDDHLFNNDNCFYRFRIDDGTFFVDSKYIYYHQGIVIHDRILADKGKFLQNYTSEDLCVTENCFKGSMLVQWLILNDVDTELLAIRLCQAWLNILIIKSVLTESTDFSNDGTLYQFVFDLKSPTKLRESLNLYAERDNNSRKSFTDSMSNTRNLITIWAGFNNNKAHTNIPGKKNDACSISLNEPATPIQPAVLRDMTSEELLSSESTYSWQNIRINCDSFGFGFVVRGTGPCYVQTVDPTSPAAAAGLKVRMYIYSVNGKVVLNMSHKEVSHEIDKCSFVELVTLYSLRRTKQLNSDCEE